MCESDLGPSMKGAGISLSSQQGRNWMLGYKQCGSSLADISDKDLPTQNFTGFDGGLFSGDGLVHLPRQGERNLPGRSIFRPREIRGTPAPVFLPEQRIHRVNGLFTNDSRSLQQRQEQCPPSASRFPPVRDLLRSGSQKRPSIAKFPPHHGQPDNFDFSRLKSIKGGKSYEMNSLTSFGKYQQRGKKCPCLFDPLMIPQKLTAPTDNKTVRHNDNGLISPVSPPAIFPAKLSGGQTSESDESFSQSLVDSPFLRLIPLDEARKKSATRRASGRDEKALPILKAHAAATHHAIRNISTASNAGTVITTPSAVATPPISRFTPRAIPKYPIGKYSRPHASTFAVLTKST